MDNYGSPSLGKMEGRASRHGSGRGRRSFMAGRILGNPFALATLSLGLIAWAVALAASVVAYSQTKKFPDYSWWAIAYYFCTLVGIMLMFGYDTVYTYRIAAVGYLSQGLFLTVSSANSLVYLKNGADIAAGIMFIILSMLAIIWIFYFGSESTASSRRFVDSFALHRSTDGPSRHTSTRPPMSPRSNNAPAFANNQNQGFGSNNLRGLETSSPTTENPPNSNPWNPQLQTQSMYGGGHTLNSNAYTSAGGSTNNLGTGGPGDRASAAPTEYGYRARAIYSYEANPEDANEISFQKHEILEVSDVSGRWWQAKKQNGETGIAPSNYLILL